MCVMLRMFTYFILCFVFISDSYGQREEGSSCTQLGFVGKCQKVDYCPIALDALARKGRHELDRCGFDGFDEIVCCPDVEDPVIKFKPGSEITTMKGPIFPNTDGNSTHPNKSTDGSKNTGRFSSQQRKCDKMCKKIYKDYNIKPPIGGQILNGQNASQGQIPHMVALGYPDAFGDMEWKCGASLISKRFLLSAAHCFPGQLEPKKARFGTIYLNDTQSAQDVDIKNTMSHPQYNPISRHNDIGLVELVRDVIMSNEIYPACLYTEDDDPKGLQIAGWGLTGNGKKATILQFARIDSVPVNNCNVTVLKKLPENTSKVILRSQICGTTKSDTCKGDSGGPLMIAKPEGGYAIVGVVSYGAECGSTTPGIYTRVVTYIGWIEDIVWPD